MVFYFGILVFLSIVVMLVAMSATDVKAMEYVQPRPVVTVVEEYEIPFDITPSVEERLLNVAKYCTTDGALEEFGSTSHCNEYYLLMIESDR
ncbi:hypothetical protein PQC39_gp097 [Vibrio phage Vp_R1]|uniref:Uncharacterized protein n=1 Tax=Vibrio phage Vp_R1 TaxID=2059867 RepID=A0A2H5BQ49_9CAUD|nr:hypothetical protein PQC39_gp097 [Vibrio phage Vp_R1]AUG88461.1 hypothetical protein VPR_097 [Vibrio phage Vp_R1]